MKNKLTMKTKTTLTSVGLVTAQQVKVSVAKSNDLSWIPRTHMVVGKNQLLQLWNNLCTL